MVARHGVPLLAARHLQEAIVGSTLMYGSEITWRGQASMRKDFQRIINRMSRTTLGVLPSTPVAFLQAEGGSVPADARLNRRQEAFAISWPPGQVLGRVGTCYEEVLDWERGSEKESDKVLWRVGSRLFEGVWAWSFPGV